MGEQPRCELVAVVRHGAAQRRRPTIRFRNPFRSAQIDAQPGCPLRFEAPRFYTQVSPGAIERWLHVLVRNVSAKTVHSYSWRHASPVANANGGFGCQPQGGLEPRASQREGAYLSWPGPLTLTIDFVQFMDGTTWLSSDPRGSVTRAGLDAGARAAGERLLDAWRRGADDAVAAALPRLHLELLQERSFEDLGRYGTSGFYAGLTHAQVRVSSSQPGNIYDVLVALASDGAI